MWLMLAVMYSLAAVPNVFSFLPPLARGFSRPCSLASVRYFSSKPSLTVAIYSEEEMEALGTIVASGVDVGGSTICLSGDLGTGKTCFARGFIRAKLGDHDLRGENFFRASTKKILAIMLNIIQFLNTQ